MATYSAGQAYVSTTRYSKDTTGLISPGTNTIYTVPSNREVEIEIQALRIANGGSNDSRFEIAFTGTSNVAYLLRVTTNVTTAFGYTNLNLPASLTGDVALNPYPFKLRLVAGDVLRFTVSGGSSNSVGYQYDFIIKEFVKA
jgi:hypothetical protein